MAALRRMRVVMGSSDVESLRVVRGGEDSMVWADLSCRMRTVSSAEVGPAFSGELVLVESCDLSWSRREVSSAR